ncbi:putative RiPP precursor [Streptomyces boncukensis]|uniref:Putative RiPP n=1 Tax=Streptomyces boncukensis TaxID=2711219 RepID=A0A6G4WZF0_9ACTN|nr:putative RiPP precursor [Streptomyces boncukensis]NGO70010.1 putative RiPP precursor [Streptomyces boncukensis]
MEADDTHGPQDTYATPVLVDLDSVPNVTFGKYAEDTQDKDRYFE